MKLTTYYARREPVSGRGHRMMTVLYRDARMGGVDKVAEFANHDKGGPRPGTKTTMLNCARVALLWPGWKSDRYHWGTSPFCGPLCRDDARSDDKHGLFWRVAPYFGAVALNRREEAAVTGDCIYCHKPLPRGRRDRIRALYPDGLVRQGFHYKRSWADVDAERGAPDETKSCVCGGATCTACNLKRVV